MKAVSSEGDGAKVAILFLQFGPYHHARVKALQQALPGRVIAAQVASASKTYAWNDLRRSCDGLITLCDGAEEDVSPWAVFRAARRFFRTHQIETVFLPSYSPARVFALYAAAVLCRCRRIMMNESHAGTERAKGWKRILKKKIVCGFHAALVGGTPQKRHFHSLGLPEAKIFTGYDTIDNTYFSAASAAARSNAARLRCELGLPERYFLSLGRFVAKKDLATLIRAFAAFRKSSTETVELVMVGSGELERELKQLAMSLGLTIKETNSGDTSSDLQRPRVYFMGFRQIDENPAFYALADAFVLPSVEEEWGLVVNEAMACGLPVIVSHAVGCAEDLVSHGENGFLFDAGDVDTLTNNLVSLAEDPELRKSMGQISRNRIAVWGCDRFAASAVHAIDAVAKMKNGDARCC